MTPEQLNALEKIASAAAACEHATGCPAELAVSQCILESGWLQRAPGNNCFGIKFARRHALSQALTTTEVLRTDQVQPGDVVVERRPDGRVKVRGKRLFAAYDSLADCMIDHARLITTAGAYSKAWNQYQADGDLHTLIAGIARVYATDPDYPAKLERILSSPAVQSSIGAARQQVTA